MTRPALFFAAAAIVTMLLVGSAPFTVAAPQAAAPLTDAKLPDTVKLGWGEEPVTTISPTRATISLNGLWRFLPAEDEATRRDPQAGWGYIRVPGNWKNAADMVARGTGRVWQTFQGDRVAQAWYERTIVVPADWAGRTILLDVGRVSTPTDTAV